MGASRFPRRAQRGPWRGERRDTRRDTSWRLSGVQLGRHAHVLQRLVRALRFSPVDPRNRQPDVHQHVVAHLCLGNAFEADFLDEAAKPDLRRAQALALADLDDLTWNAETHARPLPEAFAARSPPGPATRRRRSAGRCGEPALRTRRTTAACRW